MQHFKRITNPPKTFERIIKTLKGRKQIYKLLLTAPHPCVEHFGPLCLPTTTELMRECSKTAPVILNQKFTLKASTGSYNQQELHVVKTQGNIDYKTAISNAFLYASWWGDTELVKQMVRDHGSIIDVNTIVDGKNVLEWTVGHVRGSKGSVFRKGVYETYKVRNENAIGICRYLLNHYGPKIDANRPGGVVLDRCSWHDSGDIIAKLVLDYKDKLVNPYAAVHILITLIKEGYNDEAELFMRLNYEELNTKPMIYALLPAVRYGSTRIIRAALKMFGQVDVSKANDIFRHLCEGIWYESISDIYPKVRAALNFWSSDLTPDTIMYCLVDQWAFGQTKRRQPDMGRDHGRTCQLIVARCMNQIEDDGIQIALAACIFPSNMKLFDEVFDSHLEDIKTNPHLLYHALLECTCFGFEDMHKHIMNKCASQGVDILSRSTDIEARCRSDRQKRLTLDERYRDHPISYSSYSARSYYRMA